MLAPHLDVVAADPQLGDIDGDRMATVRDIARIVGHIQGTSLLDSEEASVADLTQDGAINQADIDLLIQEILETREPESLPLSTVRFSSPASGEGDVAVTRETIVYFTVPLALDTTLDTESFYAEFGGNKLLSRVEVSSDRTKATLFYLEPLPSNARVRVTLDGSGLSDLIGRPFDADGDGAGGGVFKSEFDTVTITPITGTAISGRIFASELPDGNVEQPLPGVTITVSGAEETLRAVTDSMGNFTLNPCPAGEFFVQIDGRTSPLSDFPSGDYYPVVGKKWRATAGRNDNLAVEGGTIYLPCICAGTLKPVSPSQDTVITFPAEVLAEFPEFAGTEIVVPPNSLFANDGTRGGMAGIAPVASNRLPEPLPPGLVHTVDISIQTDGATNFDQAVPVCFPNLPDPETGEKLAPGEQSALWSFNHDLGEWEISGSMTVTADGNFLKTDPGVGVRQPGWHGVQPGTQVDPPDPPNDQDDDSEDEDDDCPDPLEELGWGYAIDVAGTIAECAEGFVKLKGLAKKLATFAKTAKNFKNDLNRLVANIEAGDFDCTAELLAIIAFREALDEYEKELRDLLDLGDPLAKVEAIFGCIKGVMQLLSPLCAGIDEQPECWSTAGRFLCSLREKAEEAANIAKDLTATLRAALTDTAVGVLRALLIKVEGRIKARCDAEAGKKGTPPVDISDEAILRDLQELSIHFDSLSELPDLPEDGFDHVVKQLSDVLGLIGDVALDQDGALPVGFLRIEYGSITERRRTSANGGFRLILPPQTVFSFQVFDPTTGFVGTQFGVTGPNGERTILPGTPMVPDDSPDSDGDGLGDYAEGIVGTDPNSFDSDGDGVSDGAETRQGTDPTEGLLISTGVVAAAPVFGSAGDVCALNNIAITANGAGGISVFNVFSGLNPVRIVELDTPGTAVAVDCTGDLVAVADSLAGLTIVDISDPANAAIVGRIPVGTATSVVTRGPLAYVGTSEGEIVVVDLPTGRIETRVPLSGSVRRLAVDKEQLVALAGSDVVVLSIEGSNLTELGRTAVVARSLFAAEGYAYLGYLGYSVVDYHEPLSPTLIAAPDETLAVFHTDHALNGSGLLVGTSVRPFAAGVNGVALWDASNPGDVSRFLTQLDTGNQHEAISIYNGLAYIADSRVGLKVVNYLPFDTQGAAPSISLSSNEDLATGIEEGRFLRLTAEVSDDVQVRNVEFYIDGELVRTDGGYPFDLVFAAPALSAQKNSFTFRARATDTGGNFTWTDELAVDLLPDMTPPEVVSITPSDGALVGAIRSVAVRFSEAVDPASLQGGGIVLNFFGPDELGGTDDDLAVGATISVSLETNSAYLDLGGGLVPGIYELAIGPPTADIAGNEVESTYTSRFRMFSFADRDGDGVPDDWEVELGLDPDNPDSDGNGTIDGLEDFDGDGLPNAGEILLERDPRLEDSDFNGVPDGEEDLDLDGLADGEEIRRGLDPRNPDTDGDGFDDNSEVIAGTDPLRETVLSTQLASRATSYGNVIFESQGPSEVSIHSAAAPASFFNVAFEPRPTDPGVQTTASAPASFLNIFFEPAPTGPVIESVASGPASFLNIEFESFDLETMFTYSPVTSYENLEP